MAGATEYAVLAMGLAKSVHQVGEGPMSGDGCDHSQKFVVLSSRWYKFIVW